MTTIQTIGSIRCRGEVSGRARITYFITPIDLEDSDIAAWANLFNTDLVVISGMDWDNDLTPWPAKGVPASIPDFKGLAPYFLKTIKTQIIPFFERKQPARRNLCGISLSGLFALWAWMQDDTFDNIGSASGSFWYRGFVQWLRDNVRPKKGYAYFSLGNKEGGRGGDPAFRDIQYQTREVLQILLQHGIKNSFQQTRGNHYADPDLRIELMLKAVTAQKLPAFAQ